MTRKKAIEDLQLALSTGNYIFTRSRETLRMAISALSTDGEYIKKEDVIEYFNDLFGEMYQVSFSDVLQTIDSLQTYSLPDSAENKGEWIPVTEETELPEHDVICCDNEGNIVLGYLYFDEEENQIACDHDPYVMFGVVAYMEKPEPYKAESEE